MCFETFYIYFGHSILNGCFHAHSSTEGTYELDSSEWLEMVATLVSALCVAFFKRTLFSSSAEREDLVLNNNNRKEK